MLLKSKNPKVYKKKGLRLYNMDCLIAMRKMKENSVDSIITDPPYGIGFMNKKWDKGVPPVEIWKEALRVLKPGGHLVAFAGTRTQHRMCCNIEDAGFKIIDLLAWVYGSGFPKSLSVPKAIDKKFFREWLNENPKIKARMIKEIKKGKSTQEIEFKYMNIWARKIYGIENRVIGKLQDPAGSNEIYGNFRGIANVTTLVTPEAKEWNGFGSALKPSLEPISLARKPIEKGLTIAENVLKWGTGALDIDRSRVPALDERTQFTPKTKQDSGIHPGEYPNRSGMLRRLPDKDFSQGRFPANLLHDGSPEVEAVFPETGKGKSGGQSGWQTGGYVGGRLKRAIERTGYQDNGGSASRYFSCFPQERVCSYFSLTCVGKHGIMIDKEGVLCQRYASTASPLFPAVGDTRTIDSAQNNAVQKQVPKKGGTLVKRDIRVCNAESRLWNLLEIKGNTVGSLATQKARKQFVQNVRDAGNLCGLCGISFVLAIAEIKISGGKSKELHRILDCTLNFRSSILIQNLVGFAELWESTDIIPTTQSLSLLFGSAHHAIANYTEEKRPESTRLAYHGKASKADRNSGLDAQNRKSAGQCTDRKEGSEGLKSPRAGAGRTTGSINAHPTVKPTNLMRWLCRLITPPNGIILDPFIGSGSTGKAAIIEKFRFIGCELEKEHFEVAIDRIEYERKILRDKPKQLFDDSDLENERQKRK